jgi:hypothetical protein
MRDRARIELSENTSTREKGTQEVLYSDGQAALFIPSEHMWLVRDQATPWSILQRLDLNEQLWKQWKVKYAESDPWLFDWLYQAGKIREGRESIVTEAMLAFRDQTSIAAIAAAALKAGYGKLHKRKRPGPPAPQSTINRWLRRYRDRAWFKRWLIHAEAAPPGITIPTRDEIRRCRQAWDFDQICADAKLEPRHALRRWLDQEKIVGLEQLKWLYGLSELLGTFVVREELQRLRLESSGSAIARVSGVQQHTVKLWRSNPVTKAALEDAERWAAHRHGSCEAASKRLNEKHLRVPRRNIAGQETMDRMLRHATAATFQACRARTEVMFPTLTDQGYHGLLREAKRLGVDNALLDYLASRGDFAPHKSRECGFFADGKLFVPSPAQFKFRVAAAAKAKKCNVSALRSLPLFDRWFADWAVPYAMKGRGRPLKSAQMNNGKAVTGPAPERPHDRHKAPAEPEWSEPDSPSQWARLFGVHYNTMIAWLKRQIVRNKQVTPRRYRIAVDELPAGPAD